jgi:hypothetical protein
MAQGRTTRSLGRVAVAAGLALSLVVIGLQSPVQAAGVNLPIKMGQRFIGSASPAKGIALPLATKVGPLRSLAVAGVQGTTFNPIKDPVFGTTLLTGAQVKQIVLDTIAGVDDDTTVAFRIDSLDHPNPTEFTLGGNCVGADGASTPACLMTVVFKPTTAGARTDPISAEVTITKGIPEVESSLQAALAKQGIVGTLAALAYPLVRTYAQDQLTSTIEDSVLSPVATASGTGVAGPFTDPAVFIKRQFADFAAGSPTSAQVATWTANFEGGTSPATLIETLRKGSAWDGRVGPVTRLYSAYFLRSPDDDGLEFWVNRSRNGTRLYAISSTFAASSEFQRRYGSLTNAEFASLVYQNVLGRAPDPSGLAYWTRQLDKGQTRGRMMVGFSESSEYIRKQAAAVTVVELWWGMVKRAPTPAEVTGFSARLKDGTPATTIILELLASTEYRSVVLG